MTRVFPSICPWCGHRHELVSAVVDRRDGRDKPRVEPTHKDGDISFCAGCGEVALFERKAPGHIRFPTQEEYEEINKLHAVIVAKRVYRDHAPPTHRPILKRPSWMS